MIKCSKGLQSRSVWIVDQYAVPPTSSGFTRQYEHAQLLRDLGWGARIIASPFNHKTHKVDRDVSIKRQRVDHLEEGVNFSWVYTIPYTDNNWRRYLNMLSFLFTSQVSTGDFKKPDVVLASSPHLFAGLAGWALAKRFRVPFVLEVRDLWPESLVQLGLTNPFIIKPLEMLERFLYRQADAIVCLTDGIATSIRERIGNPQKVSVLPNGVMKPAAPDMTARSVTRSRMGWDETDVIAIYAGAHGDANDLDQIVDAARSLKDERNIRFVLFGDGPTKNGIRKRAQGLPNIDFHEAISKTEIVDVLRAADIGLLTLKPVPLFEGARPNKLFDYMGASLPIISTVRGEAEEVLTESGAGIGVSPESLAAAVKDFAHDQVKRQALGSSGLNYISQGETREVVTGRLADILESLIDKWAAPNGGAGK